MGREVRFVPKDWQHPTDENGRYIPLDGRSFSKVLAEYREELEQWNKGFRKNYVTGEWVAKDADEIDTPSDEWFGDEPVEADYMPDWPDEKRTHLQMYEDTTEGTPISPVIGTAANLAKWLADNNASAFGRDTATYEQWLAMIERGYSVGMVFTPQTGLISGVAAESILK